MVIDFGLSFIINIIILFRLLLFHFACSYATPHVEFRPVTMVRATGKWLQAQGHFHPSLIASVIMWIANPLLYVNNLLPPLRQEPTRPFPLSLSVGIRWLWPKLLATSPIKYASLIFTANAP